MVARILLEHGQDNTTGLHRICLSDIAGLTGTNREMVHESLNALQEEKAIKLERNRMIIDKGLLKKAAGGM
jgi:DNA-binding IclR family transcriptional regulator